MKEFTTAVADIVSEDQHEAAVIERNAKIKALVEGGKTPEEAEAAVPEVENEDKPIEFLLDGRTMHAYPPTDGQLAFMLASLGRGQTSEGRFASIINVMMECLRDDDKDYFESRLLTRDPKRRLGVKTIEAIFEHLIEEWFARPTQP